MENDVTLIPLFLKRVSEMTAPKIPATTGPIIGETNMDATRITVLSSNKPKKEIRAARITRTT